MSGFAVLFDSKEPVTVQSPLFADFVEAVANYKSLDKPEQFACGHYCLGAKLDSASSLHQGIIKDETTGSWLLAAGTVVDTAFVQPDGNLGQLLADYLEQGEAVFKRLDGHFALIIYDGRHENVIAVSDPFGIVSLFYGQKGSQFFISTSALAVAKIVQSKPSEFGVRHFLVTGNVFGEMTLWQDVKRMVPATTLQFSRDGTKKFTYWSIEIDPTISKQSLADSVDCVVNALTEATQRSLTREGKAWLSLTGGFDSRTLSLIMHHCHLPFKSYCHGPPESDDVRIATLISQKMGWDYEYFPLPEDWGKERASWLLRTLGHCDAHLGILKTSRIIREQTLKAQQYGGSLWGFGGEIYRGYYWKQEFLNVGTSSQVNYDRLFDYRISPSLSWPILKDTAGWVGKIRAELETQIKLIGEKNTGWLNTAKLDRIGTNLEGTIHAGSHISAVLGLQRAVAPFYLKDGITSVISVNHKWRTYNRLFRLMLERVNPALANIETADGGPALPMRPSNLYKFTPYWFDQGKKLIWGAGHKFLGIELWDKRRNVGSSYPMAQWRRDTLAQLDYENLLVPAKMYSAKLYDIDTFQTFLAQAQRDDFKYEGLLSRIITVEMALRSVNTSF